MTSACDDDEWEGVVVDEGDDNCEPVMVDNGVCVSLPWLPVVSPLSVMLHLNL